MAKTTKGIYYPSDYESVADVPSDLKEMAESIEQMIENEAYDDTEIKQEQIIQNTKIQTLETDNATNKQEILELKQKIKRRLK